MFGRSSLWCGDSDSAELQKAFKSNLRKVYEEKSETSLHREIWDKFAKRNLRQVYKEKYETSLRRNTSVKSNFHLCLSDKCPLLLDLNVKIWMCDDDCCDVVEKTKDLLVMITLSLAFKDHDECHQSNNLTILMIWWIWSCRWVEDIRVEWTLGRGM